MATVGSVFLGLLLCIAIVRWIYVETKVWVDMPKLGYRIEYLTNSRETLSSALHERNNELLEAQGRVSELLEVLGNIQNQIKSVGDSDD